MALPDTPSVPYIHCYVRENGIYTVVVNKSNRQAVQEAIAQYIEWHQAHPPDKRFLILIDLRPDGFPPLTHSFEQLRKMIRQYPPPPNMCSVYLLEENSPLLSVAQSLYDLLRMSTSRRFFYGPGSEEKAIAFLRKSESNS